MRATLMSYWVLAAIAGFEILLLGFVFFPDRLLTTWFRWLRVVPIVGTPLGLRTIAAIVFLLLTSMLVLNTRAWLSVRPYGR